MCEQLLVVERDEIAIVVNDLRVVIHLLVLVAFEERLDFAVGVRAGVHPSDGIGRDVDSADPLTVGPEDVEFGIRRRLQDYLTGYRLPCNR